MEIQLQCLLGMACKKFAIVAADQTKTQSVIVMNDDDNKIHDLDDNLLMAVTGNSGDAAQFTQFVAKNIDLYKLRNRYALNTSAAVHFTRRNLADNLRGGNASMLNMLIAGYHEPAGGQLYALDFLGSSIKVPFAGHGIGALMALSILEYYHTDSLTETEAYEVLKTCVHEIHKRFFVSLPKFQVKSVSKKGIKELPIINPAAFTSSRI